MLLHPSAAADRVAAAVLGAMWLWTGTAYHWLYPAAIKPAAKLFAIGFVVQGLLLLHLDVVRNYWPDPWPSRAARGPRPMTSGCAPEEAALGAAPASAFPLRGFCKTYRAGDGTVQAVRDLDLDIFAGESVVLLGPSGSGKSTLRNILGGRGLSQLSRSVPRGQG